MKVLTSMASHLVMLITAAFDPQYAAVRVHSRLVSLELEYAGASQGEALKKKKKNSKLTCCWSADYAQLTGYVHNVASVAWTPVMSRQWLLCEHLLDGCAGCEPAAAVVDAIDKVELFWRRVV